MPNFRASISKFSGFGSILGKSVSFLLNEFFKSKKRAFGSCQPSNSFFKFDLFSDLLASRIIKFGSFKFL